MSRSKSLKELEKQPDHSGLLHQMLMGLVRFEALLDMGASLSSVTTAFIKLGVEPQDKEGNFLLTRKLAEGITPDQESVYGRAALELLAIYRLRSQVRERIKTELKSLLKRQQQGKLESPEKDVERIRYLELLAEHNLKQR
jgi:hypothetical protein